MLTETRERTAKNETQFFTHAGTVYAVRSRETLSFTAYRVGSEWTEPDGKRGLRKEREFIRKGYAVVTVKTVHTNAVTVAHDEHCKRKRATFIAVRVTGEPDAVRDYLDTVATLPGVVFTADGCGWETVL